MPNTPLSEYYTKLERHDWFYDYSDDGSVWRRGQAERTELEAIAKQSPEHKALYDGFKKYHFSGQPFGTLDHPKPEKPNA